ncbi:PTS sugar transporter subunit IIA [Numidum massiliense]|uniref:PTS sugar transporter subunit IIA n=1 Tax=Numidum massiliense TaxID=1522315 RepID=UPI0006D57BE5|nr:PTS sugar transporter subunit IIA [Numidum massiliense]
MAETENKLKQLLTKERMLHLQAVSSWEQAVDLACEPLLNEGSISDLYVTNIKKNVKENGPYMVLADYFALMHAKAGEGVNELSMSLLIVDEEVDLVGVPVKLFLILAAEDSRTHIDALADITTLLMDQASFNTFLNGDIEQISRLIETNVKGGDQS